MRFNDLFHDGQTETHSAFLCRISLEFFEDLYQPVVGNARAGVANPTAHFIDFGGVCADGYFSFAVYFIAFDSKFWKTWVMSTGSA